MGITRLQRREKRIKERLASRQNLLKKILQKPVVKKTSTGEVIKNFAKK